MGGGSDRGWVGYSIVWFFGGFSLGFDALLRLTHLTGLWLFEISGSTMPDFGWGRLLGLGLTVEQVASSLGLPIAVVQAMIRQSGII